MQVLVEVSTQTSDSEGIHPDLAERKCTVGSKGLP